MGKKQKKTVAPQDFSSRKEEVPENSFFSGIVLKERTEPENTRKNTNQKPKKKAGEIVQGYDPNASFADILRSYEKTGNPYAMPKKKASTINADEPEEKQSFGDILDMWEGKTKKKAAPQRQKSEYRATRSFEDILNQYEEKPRPRPFPVQPPQPKEEAKPIQTKKVEKAKSFGDILSDFEEKKAEPKTPEVKSRDVRNINDIIASAEEPEEDYLNRTYSAKPADNNTNQKKNQQKKDFSANRGRKGQKFSKHGESEVKVSKSFADIFSEYEKETEKKVPETRGLAEIVASMSVDEPKRKHEEKKSAPARKTEHKPVEKAPEEKPVERAPEVKPVEKAPEKKPEIKAGPVIETETVPPAEEAPGTEPDPVITEEAKAPLTEEKAVSAEEPVREEILSARDEVLSECTPLEMPALSEEPLPTAVEEKKEESPAPVIGEKKAEPAPVPGTEEEEKKPGEAPAAAEAPKEENKASESSAEEKAEAVPTEPVEASEEPAVPSETEKKPLEEEKKPAPEVKAEAPDPRKKEEKPQRKEEPKGETPDAEALFRKKEEDEERNPRASWSVFGDNKSFVRPEPPQQPKNEKKSDRKERNGQKEQRNGRGNSDRRNDRSDRTDSRNGRDRNERREQRGSDYRPRKDFGKILDRYDEDPRNREKEKTFDEILAEKGDVVSKARTYTVSQLRTMNPQSTLDLHGCTQDEAEAKVKSFLVDCRDNNIRKISIITGKGLHSEGGVCVLRDAVIRVLDSSGFITERQNAPINCGGSGALWVILKKSEDIY